MSTEVKHGPTPQFTSSLTGGKFTITITGYYTNIAIHAARDYRRKPWWWKCWNWVKQFWGADYSLTQGMGAGGVSHVQFKSNQPLKQRNELLVLRTCFIDWYLHQYATLPGVTRRQAIRSLKGYPFGVTWKRIDGKSA